MISIYTSLRLHFRESKNLILLLRYIILLKTIAHPILYKSCRMCLCRKQQV